MKSQFITEPPMTPPPNAEYGIWLRSPSSSGGKEWLCFQTDRDVRSFWGKIGQVNQSTVLCSTSNRHYLEAMAKRKRAKGYQQMMEWNERHGWMDPRTGQTFAVKSVSADGTMVAESTPPPKPTPKANPVKEWLSSVADEWF